MENNICTFSGSVQNVIYAPYLHTLCNSTAFYACCSINKVIINYYSRIKYLIYPFQICKPNNLHDSLNTTIWL